MSGCINDFANSIPLHFFVFVCSAAASIGDACINVHAEKEEKQLYIVFDENKEHHFRLTLPTSASCSPFSFSNTVTK